VACSFSREHWHNVYLIGPLKQLDRGAARRQSRSPAVSDLMEIEDEQQVHRRCFSHEPMRRLTQRQREPANPESPLRLAHRHQLQRDTQWDYPGRSRPSTQIEKPHTGARATPKLTAKEAVSAA